MEQEKKTVNGFKQYCVDNGYTAETIAKKIGVSRRTVYAYYTGERLPSRRTMKKMEEYYFKSLALDM